MTPLRAFIEKHPVLAYFALTFTLSWGGILLVSGGPGALASTPEQIEKLIPLTILALEIGPSIASLLLTGLVSGRAGFSELLSRLFRWRVSARWYAVALLIIPLVFTALLLTLSLLSPEFLPAIITTDNKVSLIVPGIVVGLIGGLSEELGWTGFAVPRMRRRYGVFTTGLIVGALWQVWHLPVTILVATGSSGTLDMGLFLPLYFLSGLGQLTACRVLMVWAYDRTESLLVAMLMHASLIASTVFILVPPVTGVSFLAHVLGLAAALWGIVAVVIMVNRGQLTQPSLQKA